MVATSMVDPAHSGDSAGYSIGRASDQWRDHRRQRRDNPHRCYQNISGYRQPHHIRSRGYNSLTIVVIQIGGVALLAAWTLALAHAAQARRWRWFALMIIAGYLSYAIYYMSRLPSTIMCSFNPDSGDFSACLQPNIALVLMLALGQATGPVAMLIYALRAPGRAQRRLPEGLTVSSLHDKTWPGEDAVSAD
jgi:hypothetical protein